MRRATFFLFLAAGLAQTGRPAYEAAVIKPNVSGTNGSSTNGSRGQVVFENVTLRRLIERAYEVKPLQLTAPDWLDDVRFDISAKYPPETKPADRSGMLRTLLEDRFHLAAHRGTKEMSGYAMVGGKGGFKLHPIQTDDQNMSSNGDGRVVTVTVKGITMPQLADFLTRQLNEFVVDRTGITGKYEFEMRFARIGREPGDDPDPPPSLFTALQETLGLKLQPQKVPVDIVVVDRVDRAPTEN